jgi:hypothetical protein
MYCLPYYLIKSNLAGGVPFFLYFIHRMVSLLE